LGQAYCRATCSSRKGWTCRALGARTPPVFGATTAALPSPDSDDKSTDDQGAIEDLQKELDQLEDQLTEREVQLQNSIDQ
jgi:hypothetical protein